MEEANADVKGSIIIALCNSLNSLLNQACYQSDDRSANEYALLC